MVQRSDARGGKVTMKIILLFAKIFEEIAEYEGDFVPRVGDDVEQDETPFLSGRVEQVRVEFSKGKQNAVRLGLGENVPKYLLIREGGRMFGFWLFAKLQEHYQTGDQVVLKETLSPSIYDGIVGSGIPHTFVNEALFRNLCEAQELQR